MTTRLSYMWCRGPAVRVRPGRADTLRNWPFLQLIATACTLLQLWALGRRKRGPFIAANFTSGHVIACICRYIHVKFFSRRNHRVTILGSFRFFQRISGYSAYFSLRFFSKTLRRRHEETQIRTRKVRDASPSPAKHRTSSVFQRIPAYSNVLFFLKRHE